MCTLLSNSNILRELSLNLQFVSLILRQQFEWVRLYNHENTHAIPLYLIAAMLVFMNRFELCPHISDLIPISSVQFSNFYFLLKILCLF